MPEGILSVTFKIRLNHMVFIGLAAILVQTQSGYADRLYCFAYCNTRGELERGFYCQTARHRFCCGTESARYCCNDPSKDVSHIPPSFECKRTTWLFMHWRMVTGMLVSLILILLCAAGCYYCCGLEKARPVSRLRGRQARRASNNIEANTVSRRTDNGTIPNSPSFSSFDPASPYAFEPPAYESLPKEPPKYTDICSNIQHGTVNPAYITDSPSQVEIITTASVSTPQEEANTTSSAGRNGQNANTVSTLHSDNSGPPIDNETARLSAAQVTESTSPAADVGGVENATSNPRGSTDTSTSVASQPTTRAPTEELPNSTPKPTESSATEVNPKGAETPKELESIKRESTAKNTAKMDQSDTTGDLQVKANPNR